MLTILFVDDPARTARFYTEGLGWAARVSAPNYVEFDAGVGLMRRAAASSFAGERLAREAPPKDVLRAELYVPVSDPEAALERLVSLGGERVSEVAMRPWGDRAGYVLDPEGHLVAVAARGAARVSAADLRAVTEADRSTVQAFLTEHWSHPVVIRNEARIDAGALDAFLFEEAGQIVGLVTLLEVEDALELVTVNSTDGGRGIGRALVERAAEDARARGLLRLVLTTNNDNLPALGFYQHLGFRLVQLLPDAITRGRRLKRSIPERGHRGLPIRDELVLELTL